MTRAESNGRSTPAIAGISYVFPERSRTVGELAGDRQLNSSAATMESFGFGKVHVAVTETPYELALAASTRLLDESRVDRDSIGLLIFGGTPGSFTLPAASSASVAAANAKEPGVPP